MKRIGLLSMACATAFTLACNSGNARRDIATNNTPNETGTVGTAGEARDTATGADRDFVDKMLVAGMDEVELGRLASERGSSADVKRFGQMMVDEHTKAADELKQIATQHNIPTSAAQLDEKHRELRDKLTSLRGVAFDREYITAMVDDHQGAMSDLESRVDKDTVAEWRAKLANKTRAEQEIAANLRPERSDNPVTASINQWAANTLPSVQQHLDRAKAIDERLDRPNRNTTK